VLALVLEFGVVERGPQIGAVFKRTMDYGVLKVQVSKESSTGLTASLADFDARAGSGSSRPLHLWNDGETIEVLVPIDETGVSDVKIYLTARPGAREIRDKIVENYELPWNEDKQAKPEAGFWIIFAIQNSA
jgi:hypothetical protein